MKEKAHLRFIRSIFLSKLFFQVLFVLVIIAILGYFFSPLYELAQILLVLFVAGTLLNFLLLFRIRDAIGAKRDHNEKFSNGDDNDILLTIENGYPFSVHISIIDEIPFQFQARNIHFEKDFQAGESKAISYTLRPTERGEYQFGNINLFVSTKYGFIERKYVIEAASTIAVYPSYLQMRKFELYAISNRLSEVGIKPIRKLGHASNFEQIKQYVYGDDPRSLNWKATARRGQLMVNLYEDEKSQQVYSVIDMGRTMKMPFDGLTLLDYAINASLVISNIAIHKEDKAGIITFAEEVKTLLKADRKGTQMRTIQEILYKQSTGFLEADFERLYTQIRHKIPQRSLLLIYTNFESLTSMQRQLKYLRAIAKAHVVVLIFFENTELKSILTMSANSTEQIYIKTIAEKFAFEKREIVRELSRYGIYSILTTPENLTVGTINKYLELKAQGII